MREITHLFASWEEEKDFKTIHSNRSWSSNAGRAGKLGRQAIDLASAGPNFGRSISFRLEF
jgi:hypothetical protein